MYFLILVKGNFSVTAGFQRQVLPDVKIAADVDITGFAGDGKILSGCFQLSVSRNHAVFTGNFHASANDTAGYVDIPLRSIIMQCCQVPGCYVTIHYHITVFPFAGLILVNLYRSILRTHAAGHRNTAACQSL